MTYKRNQESKFLYEYKNKYLPGQGLVKHLSDSLSEPMQFFPPWKGDGLLHFRFLTLIPRPQVLEQLEYCPHSPHLPSTKIEILRMKRRNIFKLSRFFDEIKLEHLPEQRLVLHIIDSLSDPIQCSPPWEGEGLLHFRFLLCVPVPHVFVQAEYCPHLPHFPSTKNKILLINLTTVLQTVLIFLLKQHLE